MSNSVFPAPSTTPGLAWGIVKRPRFNTKVQEAVSLWELRSVFAPYPQWQWTLSFNVLRSASAYAELQSVLDFYLARQGAFDSFLFDDLSDDSVTDQQFGLGDGTTTAFQLLRSLKVSGFLEPIYNTNGAPVIKDNGVTKTAGVDYNISASGLVTFTYTPIIAHSLTWTGSYYWRCRFADDAREFVQFVNKFWELKALSFVSVLGS